MKTLLTLLLIAASAFGQTATISDTIRTPFGGTFSGTVTVSLNSPALAQPLYSGSVTLSGWTQAVTVTAGVFTLTLYTNDLITPGGTSYTAAYAPTSGSGWKETWIVPTGATTIREIRSTTVPSPSVRFTPSQITQSGATLGQGLKWDGSKWAPADVVANPMTTNGDLITRLGGVPVRVGIGSTNQVLTVSGGMPVWASGIAGNASTATALAANGTNCTAGSYPLGVDVSGNAEGCTAAVTASTGLSDSADIVRGGAALTTVGSVPFVTSAGVLGSEAAFSWDAANNRLGVGIANPGFLTHFVGIAGTDNGWSRTTWQDATNTTRSNWVNGVGFTTIGTITADAMVFAANNVEAFRINPTTRHVSVGTTTDDGTNRLQVAGNIRLAAAGSREILMRDTNGSVEMQLLADAASLNIGVKNVTNLWSINSSGTNTLYNQTPTTGSTSLVVRAGAGQGSDLLQVFASNGTTSLFRVDRFGVVVAGDSFVAGAGSKMLTTGFAAANNAFYGFSSTSSSGGAIDTTLSRRVAGLLELNSGTAIGITPGNARDIMLRRTFAAETTTDPSAADLTIAGSNAQDVAAIYVKNDKLVVAYNRSGTVNYLTIPLDGATTTFTQSTTAP